MSPQMWLYKNIATQAVILWNYTHDYNYNLLFKTCSSKFCFVYSNSYFENDQSRNSMLRKQSIQELPWSGDLGSHDFSWFSAQNYIQLWTSTCNTDIWTCFSYLPSLVLLILVLWLVQFSFALFDLVLAHVVDLTSWVWGRDRICSVWSRNTWVM